MSKRQKHPNVYVTFYDGHADIVHECPAGHCKFARFYCEPPDADEPCAYCATGRACTWPPAREAAIEAVIKMLLKVKVEEDE